MWEALGETLQAVSFAYLAAALTSALIHDNMASKGMSMRSAALQGFSPQTLAGFGVLHTFRLPIVKVSRWNEVGPWLDVLTFCVVTISLSLCRPVEWPENPFGYEVIDRIRPSKGTSRQVASFLVLLALCSVIGVAYDIFGGSTIREDDRSLGYGPIRSYLSQVHLALDGLVLLPQSYHLHQRCRAAPDEPVPQVLANFLAVSSCSRVSFAISGVGFFVYVSVLRQEVDMLELYYAITQVINLTIFADFFYYYVKARSRGEPIVLPNFDV